MLEKLGSEQPNPASESIDRIDTAEILVVMNAEDRGVPEAVGREIPRIAAAVDAIEQRWRQGGRLIYIGAGTSGRLGALDAAEIPPTFGEDPNRVVALIAGGPSALQRSVEGAEDSAEQGANDLTALNVNARDAVVGIAASGRTPYVLGAVRRAREVGVVTVGVTTNPDAELSALVDFPIVPVVGPEVVTGSTRMKSGTAQKLTLNMISTALMIRTGHTYGNRMVNVQPTNEKLRARALRLVIEIGRTDQPAAAAALEASGDVRTAILMVRDDLNLDDARARLQAAGGVLRRAMRSTE